MPTSSTWVCFDCRQAVRGFYPGPAKCSRCGGELTGIGFKIPVPSKSDVRGWRSLREQLQKAAIDAQVQKYEKRVKRIHAIEQRIKDIEARPKNENRAQLVNFLRQNLRWLQRPEET